MVELDPKTNVEADREVDRYHRLVFVVFLVAFLATFVTQGDENPCFSGHQYWSNPHWSNAPVDWRTKPANPNLLHPECVAHVSNITTIALAIGSIWALVSKSVRVLLVLPFLWLLASLGVIPRSKAESTRRQIGFLFPRWVGALSPFGRGERRVQLEQDESKRNQKAPAQPTDTAKSTDTTKGSVQFEAHRPAGVASKPISRARIVMVLIGALLILACVWASKISETVEGPPRRSSELFTPVRDANRVSSLQTAESSRFLYVLEDGESCASIAIEYGVEDEWLEFADLNGIYYEFRDGEWWCDVPVGTQVELLPRWATDR